jgi:hypothetical protein
LILVSLGLWVWGVEIEMEESQEMFRNMNYRVLETKSISMIDEENENIFTLETLQYAKLDINLRLIPTS